MSDMKCPICNKPMKQATYDYDKKDNDDTLYMSIMPCDCLCNFAASKAVWQELIRTRKELEQSEICCTEWEKQALDYKAENIALSDELERTRKALDVAVDALDAGRTLARIAGFEMLATGMDEAVNKITALEQKDVK